MTEDMHEERLQAAEAFGDSFVSFILSMHSISQVVNNDLIYHICSFLKRIARFEVKSE